MHSIMLIERGLETSNLTSTQCIRKETLTISLRNIVQLIRNYDYKSLYMTVFFMKTDRLTESPTEFDVHLR
jgi:hypothetical protein